ncbi:Predicted outer membrane protein [Amycolatopsis xylanica]|uniref:Predicted outer membrane protein n=1 Tax=Amycolatopsis xylanica TaxID=589385 RepID=A0A1H2URR3_9PSEU|nr:DUF4142 domain-containing protein [Amycolatopsis xylanica]SDW58782.1 Predicted outer membrane protein [Amycolatopsis xylanica]
MRSVSERLRAAAVLLVLLVLGQFALAAIAGAQQAQPVTSTDETLIVKVRLAGLWEMPAGNWARTRGASPRVKEVGMSIMVDHGRLDVQDRALAAELGIGLPDRPTAEQQGWLDEMQNARTPAEFDRIFVNRLRAAHGVIFSAIAQIRAGTRNDRIRAFATTANQAVLRHITLLESTGLAEFDALPQPQLSSVPASAALDLKATDIITVVVLALLLGGATVLLLWLIRNSRTRLKLRPGELNE